MSSKSATSLELEINTLQKELFSVQIQNYLLLLDEDRREKEQKRIVESLKECLDYYDKMSILRNSHFGYPANMVVLSPIVDLIKQLEKWAFLANNCGDVFEVDNYKMDSKKVECDILSLFADKFGIKIKDIKDGKSGWGYITSGDWE